MAKESRDGLPILEFADAHALEKWFAAQPRDSMGFWLKLQKRGSGRATLAKSDAIDAALCHGWIDGQLASYDAQSWLIHFTPRKRGSKWSQINRSRALALIKAARMKPAGLAEIEAAKADGRWSAAYAPASTATVPEDLQAALNKSVKAATFFTTLKGANRYSILYRIQAVKTPAKRAERIATIISMLERGETFH